MTAAEQLATIDDAIREARASWQLAIWADDKTKADQQAREWDRLLGVRWQIQTRGTLTTTRTGKS